MALTDQPYLPLYVMDWLTNNNLKIASPEAHGLMINIMCVMHKEDDYGKILLRQKFKQNGEQTPKQNASRVSAFAKQLAKLLPFVFEEIENSLEELISEGVLILEQDNLICERMVKDGKLSATRSKAGKKANKKTKKEGFADGFAEDFATANAGAKTMQITEHEHEHEYEHEHEHEYKDCKGKDSKEKPEPKPNHSFNDLDNSSLFSVEELAKIYASDEKLLDAVSKSTGRSKTELKNLLPDFALHLNSVSRSAETPSEFARYFLNKVKHQQGFKNSTTQRSKNSTGTYAWKTKVSPEQRGTKRQYDAAKKNFAGQGFKTIKTPSHVQ